MSCLINFLKNAVHRIDDLVRGLGPAEWLGLLVVDFQVVSDRLLHGDDRAMASPPQLVLRQAGEEPLDQVDPGAVGRREVAVEAAVAEQPALHLVGLVGGVVVQDHVDRQVVGDGAVDVPQEADEVDGAVAALDLADDVAGGDVQGREQRGGAVPAVVVGAGLGRADVQRQRRLGPFQRLDPALLVHAQHQRLVGRVQVQPHDVAHLLHEVRVGGELEAARQVRLQAEGPPDPVHEVPGNAQLLRQAAHAPVRRLPRAAAQRGLQDRLHLLIAVAPRLAGAGRVGQPRQPPAGEAAPPLAHRLLAGPVAFGNRLAGQAGRAVQHDPRPHVQPRAPGALAAPTLKLRFLLIAQHDCRCRSSHGRTLC